MKKLLKWVFMGFIAYALLTLFACNPNQWETTDGMIIVSTEEGDPYFNPSNRGLGTAEPIYRWRFQESTKYNLNEGLDVVAFSGDQKDWCKLVGLSWNLFSNHINTSMVGWRYNPDTDLFQLNAYSHVNEARVFTAPLMKIPINETFQTQVRRVVVDWTDESVVEIRIKSFSNPDTGYIGEEVSYLQEFQRQNLGANPRKLGTYFGGNIPTPHYLHLLRSKNRIATW